MDNARALDERLRRIIREISNSTGGEIKQNLVNEFTSNIESTIKQLSENHSIKVLLELRSAIRKL